MENMKNEEFNKEQNKNAENSLSRPARMRLVAITAILSMVFGAIGGAGGVLYLASMPEARDLLSLSNQAPAGQKITLTEDSAVIDVVEKTGKSVVSVVVTRDLSRIPGFGFNPFEDFFFPFGRGMQPEARPNPQQVGAGTGFFVSDDGLILTNKHVVDDERATYSVITNDGKTYDAEVMSRDPVNDLAILKIDIQGAPKLELADSSEVRVGQRVVAIGNSLGQYQNTVTTGIISGIGRSIVAGNSQGEEQLDGVIQTDAAINPGNSGGPLLNLAGQVIGVNTAVDRQGQLVGFAIPSNDVSKALSSFQKFGKITRPFLGVRYIIITDSLAEQENLPRNHGALIMRGQSMTEFAVLPGSPADRAGLAENDIILEVNGNKVTSDSSLQRLLKDFQVGDEITLRVYHRGEEKDVKVRLGEAN